MSVQLELFDIAGIVNKHDVSIDAYYKEFRSLANHQRGNAGYGGDVRAEREIRKLTAQGEESYKDWKAEHISDEACKDALYEFIVRLWCVKVNGRVCRDIYQNPQPPKVYNPVFDDNLASRMPSELCKQLPQTNIILVSYEERDGSEHRSYHLTYYRQDTNQWFVVGILYDIRKQKWSESKMTKLYGEQFRADRENQWWTRQGFELAKAVNKLDPQIAAVWSNYVKFYGRDEALCRLGLPPVSAGLDERDFEECDKYAWYSTEQRGHGDICIQPRRGHRRRSVG
ncbi:hypothetical protein [Paenibacillus gansuensis]|uniref:WYL domain-containing protein n=1 Tax=Paenibacillus gansuensis TaxID=306542 RepID=A0ABW5PIK2_9BACL